MHDQKQIELEQDGVLVLATILAYGDGLVWTRRTISHVTYCPEQRVEMAVERLQGEGYITVQGGQYKATLDGLEYFAWARRRCSINISTHGWKDEALTGVAQRGAKRTHGDWQRSGIDNAVLPGAPSHPTNEQTPERMLEQMEGAYRIKLRICQQLGIDMAEYRHRIADGSLRICKGHDGVSHVGIFGRHGKGWRHVCKRCRQKLWKQKQKGKA